MSTIAIVGGHGQIARRLIPLLVSLHHTPLALVRNPAQVAELEELGARVRMLDIEADEADAFAKAFDGAHAVVFAAGGGPDGDIGRKKSVDLGGSIKSIDGAKQAGIHRFVQVSAVGVDDPIPDDTGAVWRAYVEAKRDADAALRTSGLDWTIIRPGGLTDDPGTGKVELGSDVGRGEVTRDDVAAVLAEVIDSGHGIGQQWTLQGGDVPVKDAVATAE